MERNTRYQESYDGFSRLSSVATDRYLMWRGVQSDSNQDVNFSVCMHLYAKAAG